MIAALAAVDVVWDAWAGLTFHGWAHPVGAVVAMLLLAGFYLAIRPRTQIAETALYAALWIAFTLIGAIQTYLGAALARPLVDASFAHVDEALGFDWAAWTVFIRAHPASHILIRVAYYSLMPQTIATIIVLAVRNVRGRNEELLLNAGVALVLTTALATWLPAMGPFVHYGIEAFNPTDSAYVGPLIALRGLPLPPFALDDIQGIITFPSFHAVLACLFVYAHRGLRWSFRVALAVNALMLLGIPSEGGHYLVDVAGGIAVAAVAIAVVASVPRWARLAQSSAARTRSP